MKLGVVTAALGALTAAAAGLTRGFQLAAEFETAHIAMETLLGSAEQARTMLDQLMQFAATTPFEFPELQGVVKRMLALGTASEDVLPMLRTMGDATAALGGGSELMNRMVLAIGQMRAKGFPSGEEMRQLAEAGIPAWEILADTIGTSIPEAMKLARNRAIDVDVAIEGLLRGMDERFGGATERLAKTLSGRLSTLRDSIGFLLRDIAQAIIDGFNVKGGISGLITGIDAVRAVIVPKITAIIQFIARGVSALWGMIRPVIMTVVGFIRDNLSTIVTFIVRRVSTNIGVIIAMLSAFWSAISSGVNFLLGLVAPVVGGLDGVASGFAKMEQIATLAMLTIEFGFRNWSRLIEFAFVKVTASLVTFGNQVHYWFAEVVPSVLVWFAGNWKDIFITLGANTLTFFENLGSNILRLFRSLPQIMRGELSVGDIWQPLTDGFVNVIKELPEIPAREMGALERELHKESERLGNALSADFNKFVTGRLEGINATANVVTDTLTGMFSFQTPDIQAPEIPKLTMDEESKKAISGFGKGEFRQIDLERLATGVVSEGRGKTQEVRAPRMEGLLTRIAENTENNVAVAAA